MAGLGSDPQPRDWGFPASFPWPCVNLPAVILRVWPEDQAESEGARAICRFQDPPERTVNRDGAWGWQKLSFAPFAPSVDSESLGNVRTTFGGFVATDHRREAGRRLSV